MLPGLASCSMRAARCARPANGRVVHAQVAADRAHDNLAGIQPNADLHVNAVSMKDVRRVALDPFLHAQRRVASPHRMILVGKGSAEDSHDAIAG